MEKIIILGRGGHARSIVDTIEREGKYQVAGYVINDVDFGEWQDEYHVIGNDNSLVELYKAGIRYAAIGVGYLGKSDIRKKLYMQLKQIGYSMPVICDPSAIVSSRAKIEEGTFLGKGAIVNAGATIERVCIINSGSIIEHDCYIGEFSHVAVGTVLCGGVYVGANTFIGANATVMQEVRIGDRTIIGAGSLVMRDVGKKCTLVGNPGREIREC